MWSVTRFPLHFPMTFSLVPNLGLDDLGAKINIYFSCSRRRDTEYIDWSSPLMWQPNTSTLFIANFYFKCVSYTSHHHPQYEIGSWTQATKYEPNIPTPRPPTDSHKSLKPIRPCLSVPTPLIPTPKSPRFVTWWIVSGPNISNTQLSPVTYLQCYFCALHTQRQVSYYQLLLLNVLFHKKVCILTHF